MKPPEPRLDPERRAAMRATLVEHARAEERAPRRRRWRLPLLIPVFVVAAAGGAAAAAGLFSGEIKDPDVVACYRAADLGAEHELVVTDVQTGERTATDLCAPYWRRGAFGDGGSVPPLIACARDAQTIVVPGGRQACAKLGLQAIAAETFQSQARRRAAFQKGLDTIDLSVCRSPEAVRRRLLEVLERNRMAGWSVRIDTGDRCVNYLQGSYDRREIRITNDDDEGMIVDESSFGMGGSAGDEAATKEITPEEVDDRSRAAIRRACSEEARSALSDVLSCLGAKGQRECVKVELAVAAAQPLLAKELGPGAKVLVRGEGPCLLGWEIDDATGEVFLDAGDAP
jgi:hypothetical protein